MFWVLMTRLRWSLFGNRAWILVWTLGIQPLGGLRGGASCRIGSIASLKRDREVTHHRLVRPVVRAANGWVWGTPTHAWVLPDFVSAETWVGPVQSPPRPRLATCRAGTTIRPIRSWLAFRIGIRPVDPCHLPTVWINLGWPVSPIIDRRN